MHTEQVRVKVSTLEAIRGLLQQRRRHEGLSESGRTDGGGDGSGGEGAAARVAAATARQATAKTRRRARSIAARYAATRGAGGQNEAVESSVDSVDVMCPVESSVDVMCPVESSVDVMCPAIVVVGTTSVGVELSARHIVLHTLINAHTNQCTH